MQVFLIPVDGSEYSKRAVDYAIGRVKSSKESIGIHILNVQAPIITVNVKLFVSQDSLQDYYRDEGTKALAPALDTLSSNGIEASPHIGVGDPAKVICEYALERARRK